MRERVVRVYEKGDGSMRQLACRYEVSRNTVQAWINRKRNTGVVTPLPTTGGKVSQSVRFEDHLAAMVQTHPDYTLAQYCETWLGPRVDDIVPKTKETLIKLLQLGRILSSSETLRNDFAHCCYYAS